MLIWLFLRIAQAYNEPGSVIMHNKCDFALHIQGVDKSLYLQQKIGPGDTLHLPFRESVNGTGNSLKIATKLYSDNIAQVEYSACFLGNFCSPKSKVFYDLSYINGNLFLDYGVKISPSFTDCVTVNCPASDQHCDFVYYQPYDNQATQGCDVGTNLNVYLCSG